jgi:hypothetical protein
MMGVNVVEAVFDEIAVVLVGEMEPNVAVHWTVKFWTG